MFLPTFLATILTVQVNAVVTNVVMCPDVITFQVPDGNIFEEYGTGLKIGDTIKAEYNPVTKELHLNW